jgi:hypothetical protein
MKPPVTVIIDNSPDWTVEVEVPGLYGNSAGVAARLRTEGHDAANKGGRVIVKVPK